MIPKYFDIGSWVSCIVGTIFSITGKMCYQINTHIWNLLHKCISDTYKIRLINFPRPYCRTGVLKLWTWKAERQILQWLHQDSETPWMASDMACSLTFLCSQEEMQCISVQIQKWENCAKCVRLGGSVLYFWFLSLYGKDVMRLSPFSICDDLMPVSKHDSKITLEVQANIVLNNNKSSF